MGFFEHCIGWCRGRYRESGCSDFRSRKREIWARYRVGGLGRYLELDSADCNGLLAAPVKVYLDIDAKSH